MEPMGMSTDPVRLRKSKAFSLELRLQSVTSVEGILGFRGLGFRVFRA